MKSFFEEFKAFAVKGNVVDLAVAVIIGGAFGKIVSSLVDTIVMPLIGIILGGVDFTLWGFNIGAATIAYGKFVQSVVDFVIIAFVIFLALRALSRFEKKTRRMLKAERVPWGKETEPTGLPVPSEEVLLLREIRDSVRK